MYYIVVNPASKSGKGIKIWKSVEKELISQKVEYELYLSKESGDVPNIVKDICTKNLTESSDSVIKIIALGGDGTLNEVLQGITDFTKVEVGYIPTGSSNDLARDLKFPKDPIACLNNILKCENPTSMDIGCLKYDAESTELSRFHGANLSDTRYFDVSCGIGYDAAVCEEALVSPMKKSLNKIGLGKLVYLCIALKNLFTTNGYNCHITLDDEIHIELPEFMFAVCMMHKYEGGGFMFCPDADYTDGIIDVCTCADIGRLSILFALPSALKGKHFRYNGINKFRAKKVHIETSLPCWVHTDGEVTMKSSSITITCNKEALKLLF